MISDASFNLFVIEISSADGMVQPVGWLCKITIAAQLLISADLKISLG